MTRWRLWWTEKSELITIYYGESVKQEDADTLLASAKERFGNCEIELHYGGQARLLLYNFCGIEKAGNGREKGFPA